MSKTPGNYESENATISEMEQINHSCETRFCLIKQVYQFRDFSVEIPDVEAHVLLNSGSVIISQEEQQLSLIHI